MFKSSRCVYPKSCFLLLTFLFPFLAYAAHSSSSASTPLEPLTNQSLHIRLGAENSWAPYSDDLGQGISRELISAALANSGIEAQFQVLPYARVLHDLESGKIDGGFNISRQQSTEARYVFGEVPLFSVEAHWFFRAGDYPEVTNFKELPNKFRVGVIRDYEYGDHYENHRHRFHEIKVSQQSQLIRLLIQGRIDAALMFSDEARFAMKKMQLKPSLLDKRFLNHRTDIYVAFSPRNPNARWIATRLDEGLLRIQATGEYERIMSSLDNDL